MSRVVLRLLTVTFDARDPARLAQFWARLLGRKTVPDGRSVQLPGDETQIGLRFVPSDQVSSRPTYLHLHLTSASVADQHRTVQAALRLGARHLDVGQRPEEGHIVMADPEGNTYCVIEPGNAYLAGCGFLGEIACDGTRKVGLFWSEALGWPLVWDQDQETAIQSPHGGTKVAWGGASVASRQGKNRQRFHLVAPAGEQAGEVDRLVSLGAVILNAEEDGAIELADPDGNQFSVRSR